MSEADTAPDPIDAGSADTLDNRGKVVTTTLERGDLLGGRYRIDRELGRGGMGTVYAAWDSLAELGVAIKLVGGSASQQAQLREEVRASMLLAHRNITRTHTLDEIDGETFIVMERLEGETLAARIARGPLPRDQALDVVGQLLAALEAAHGAGVVHRDVKPANVMCCTDGRVVLMDFGIARIGDGPLDRQTATHTTSVKGTPAYMAPEVVSGRRADPRADLYAVGLILFEVLTGEPPFKSATVTALMFDQLNTPIDTAGLDRSLARVVQRATAKDPAQRYASASELRRAIVAPAPVRVAPAAHPPQVVAPSRRWVWLAALLVVVAGGATAFTLQRRPVEPTPRSARDSDALLFGFQQLRARICECPDGACGRKLLTEMAPLIQRLDESADPTERLQLNALGSEMGRCLYALGVSSEEIAAIEALAKQVP